MSKTNRKGNLCPVDGHNVIGIFLKGLWELKKEEKI